MHKDGNMSNVHHSGVKAQVKKEEGYVSFSFSRSVKLGSRMKSCSIHFFYKCEFIKSHVSDVSYIVAEEDLNITYMERLWRETTLAGNH